MYMNDLPVSYLIRDGIVFESTRLEIVDVSIRSDEFTVL